MKTIMRINSINIITTFFLFLILHCFKTIHLVSCDFLSFKRNQYEQQQQQHQESFFPEEESYPCECNSNVGDNEKSSSQYAKIAYLITLHNERTLLDALSLFRAIRSPYSLILIHIDTKFTSYKTSPLMKEINECPCGSEIHLDSLFSSEWGQWSMNYPTLWAMELLCTHPKFRHEGMWDNFINLSADSMPVYQPEIISKLYAQNAFLKKRNYVVSSMSESGFWPTYVVDMPKNWHKRTAYPSTPPVFSYNEKSIEIKTYFGSQWMSLTRDFVFFFAIQMRIENSFVNQYAEYLQKNNLVMSDETFFPSILMTFADYSESDDILPPNDIGKGIELTLDGSYHSTMYAMRFERMDEHMPTYSGYFPLDQRYEVSNEAKDIHGVEDPKVWGPYFLGVYDFRNIRQSGALFIRKVSVLIDSNIVNLLPVSSQKQIPDIGWNPDLQIQFSEKPDWNKIKQELIKKAKAREQREKLQKHKISEDSKAHQKNHLLVRREEEVSKKLSITNQTNRRQKTNTNKESDFMQSL